MKLQVYHHNGQLAEFPVDAVTGLRFAPETGLEELTPEATQLNAQLAAAVNAPAPPTQEPPAAPPPPEPEPPAAPEEPPAEPAEEPEPAAEPEA